MNLRQKADDFVFLTIVIGPTTCIILLILIISSIKSCVGNEQNPIDASINKSKELVTQLKVIDDKGDGFRIAYFTSYAVTAHRLEEIRSRKNILNAFKKLQYDAPVHWMGNLLNTDICEFALFARRYNVDSDIYIHNIFVCGVTKMNLYVQHNPGLPGYATWMNFSIEQGNQYLTDEDINYRLPSGEIIYRYWKCNVCNETSDTDERFSHFTEEERLR